MSTPVCIRDPCSPPPRINFFYVSRIAARTPPLSLSLCFSIWLPVLAEDETSSRELNEFRVRKGWHGLRLVAMPPPLFSKPPDENIIIVDKEKDTLFRSEFRGKISLKIGRNRDEENRGISLLYELVSRVLLSDSILHSK